jgi:hypothetical protein
MTFADLRDFHELMLRAYVRNMMVFATLPYHLAAEMRGDRMRCLRARIRSESVDRLLTPPIVG